MVYNESKILIGVGDRIHDAFLKSGMTYKELKDKSGIARHTMAHYYMGSAVPNLKTLLALCNAFDIRIDELIGA